MIFYYVVGDGTNTRDLIVGVLGRRTTISITAGISGEDEGS